MALLLTWCYVDKPPALPSTCSIKFRMAVGLWIGQLRWFLQQWLLSRIGYDPGCFHCPSWSVGPALDMLKLYDIISCFACHSLSWLFSNRDNYIQSRGIPMILNTTRSLPAQEKLKASLSRTLDGSSLMVELHTSRHFQMLRLKAMS